jgi:hypothetical protein
MRALSLFFNSLLEDMSLYQNRFFFGSLWVIMLKRKELSLDAGSRREVLAPAYEASIGFGLCQG